MTAEEVFEELDVFDGYSYEGVLDFKRRVDEYWKSASPEEKIALWKDGRLEYLGMLSSAIEDIISGKAND